MRWIFFFLALTAFPDSALSGSPLPQSREYTKLNRSPAVLSLPRDRPSGENAKLYLKDLQQRKKNSERLDVK